MSKLLVLVLVFVVGCVGGVGQESVTQPGEEAPEKEEPTPAPVAPPVEESPYVVDSPVLPGNWQCYTCESEGRRTYVCASPATLADLLPITESLPGCNDAPWGVALSNPGPECVGVWLKSLDQGNECVIPGQAGARTLLAMCGPDSDDVAMVCQ